MLSKFRIDYSDVIVITDINKKPAESSRAYFDGLVKNFVNNEDGQGNHLAGARSIYNNTLIILN